MIKLRVSNQNKQIDLRFPITEENLDAAMAELYPGKSAIPCIGYVEEVYWPEELTLLVGQNRNLDEINYLARRMDGFDSLEIDQFLAGVAVTKVESVKDMINIACNIDKFALVQDVSSYGKIGRAYVMNLTGMVPTNDEGDPKYTEIGKHIIERGIMQFTNKGLLIYDPLDELREEYNGHAFPPYYDQPEMLAGVVLSFNDMIELLQLPDDPLAIQKAVARLGAEAAEDCEITIECGCMKEDWVERFRYIIDQEGIYSANSTLQVLSEADPNWEKLSAVMEITGSHSAANIGFIAKNLEDFEYLPGVADTTEIGHYLVENFDEYSLDMEMDDFFDYTGFGEFIAEEHDGQFVDSGFVYFVGEGGLEAFMDRLESEDQGMKMGGM